MSDQIKHCDKIVVQGIALASRGNEILVEFPTGSGGTVTERVATSSCTPMPTRSEVCNAINTYSTTGEQYPGQYDDMVNALKDKLGLPIREDR